VDPAKDAKKHYNQRFETRRPSGEFSFRHGLGHKQKMALLT
jgi:hypothetical protein